MTGPNPDHNPEDHADGDLPYEKDAPNAYQWTEAAYELLGNGLDADITTVHDISTVRVVGKCPRCKHHMLFEQVLDIVSGEDVGFLHDTLTRAAVADQWLEIAASCRCGEGHKDRPEGITTGCGINFRIDLQAGGI